MSATEQNYKGRTAYRINEASEMLGISRSTIYAMMNDGRLGYTVFCGIRFIAASDIPGLGKKHAHEQTPWRFNNTDQGAQT